MCPGSWSDSGAVDAVHYPHPESGLTPTEWSSARTVNGFPISDAFGSETEGESAAASPRASHFSADRFRIEINRREAVPATL